MHQHSGNQFYQPLRYGPGNLVEWGRVNNWVQKSLEKTRYFIKSLTSTAKEIIPANVGNLFAEFPGVKPQLKLKELMERWGEEYGQESVGQNSLVLNG